MERKYGFLMIGYDKPEFIQELQNMIPYDEVYFEEGDDDCGIIDDTHVTLVPCMDKQVDVDELKGKLLALDEYYIQLLNISKFECEKYDVLKCDVGSENLMNTNNQIKKEYPTYSDYTEYHPHLTIAYLKKGMADKYLQEHIVPLTILKPTHFIWSGVDNNGNDVNMEWI